MKTFYINPKIGTAKHSVSFHDGVQTHKDGSQFFGLKIFKNKKKLSEFVRDLQNNGYCEKRS